MSAHDGTEDSPRGLAFRAFLAVDVILVSGSAAELRILGVQTLPPCESRQRSFHLTVRHTRAARYSHLRLWKSVQQAVHVTAYVFVLQVGEMHELAAVKLVKCACSNLNASTLTFFKEFSMHPKSIDILLCSGSLMCRVRLESCEHADNCSRKKCQIAEDPATQPCLKPCRLAAAFQRSELRASCRLRSFAPPSSALHWAYPPCLLRAGRFCRDNQLCVKRKKPALSKRYGC